MSSVSFLLLCFSVLLSDLSPLTAQQQRLSSFSISESPWKPDQNRILISPNSTFAAGFQKSPKFPQLYIFSIWYFNSSYNTSVWSINGDSPFTRSSSLVITTSGNLLLNDSTGKNLWIPAAVGKPNTSELVLGEDGNLVFEKWMSFDYPTHTFLPNQTMNGVLVSENGKFTFQNSTFLVFNSSDVYWPTNPNQFQKLDFDGRLIMGSGAPMISDDVGAVRLRRFTLDEDGNLRVYSLDPNSGKWRFVWQAVQELCTIHGTCGPNYICMNNGFNGSSCVCPPGFHVINGGLCERKIPLNPVQDTKFLRLDYVNFTGGLNQTDTKARNFTTCEALCLAKPNCLGFAFKFNGQRYCVLQLDKLLYGYWSPGTETAMFLRVSNSEIADASNYTGMTTMFENICPVLISLPLPPKESNTKTRNLLILCTVFAIEIICGVLSFWAFLKKYIKYRDMAQTLGLEFLPAGGPQRFTYSQLKTATNDFSNVVGHGGFGIVYKGVLPDHRIVAVKRLKDVAGGDAEFWAEVTIIARMHHLNLVRMWGFCAEKAQRMLVYEYIPNGSLDKFLFPAGRSTSAPATSESQQGNNSTDNVSDTYGHVEHHKPILDWSIRYRIAVGVARAIAYLHEECLEWVLHCDIKPENILLEDDFCPKVSDFGLAKLAKKEDMVSMSRIRGTRGYMAPEWVKLEPITSKADVYSFGMVLLEIVSGKRNFEFRRSSVESEDWYFPRWAFEKVYKEMNVEDILDRRILNCYDSRVHFDMVDRMVKTAMWCLQDRADMRPSMGKVAKMLEGSVEITEPGKPTIFYLAEEDG